MFSNYQSVPAASQPESVPVAENSSAAVNISLSAALAGAQFTQPVQVTHAGDGSGRLFVVQQDGKVMIIKNGQLLATPFLDVSNLVILGGERGLLGLAFHPDFPTTPYFYLNYTRTSDGATVIARYSLSLDPDQADASSAYILLTIAQPYSNHNGGQLLFSPVDGYLYIGMGDGGSGGDPQNRAQNLDTLLGKMLRLDVDSASPYAIPADNPYVNLPGLDEIWASGLRNPWRFSFDRLTGDLYIADVGQGAWEEVDFQAASTPGGLNFGWRCREGRHDYNFEPSCQPLTLIEPVAEYDHSLGCSITGGFVYRGHQYPNLTGRYFFGDYCSGRIWSIYQTSTDPIAFSTPEMLLISSRNISSFGEDEAGELYVVDLKGSVHQLVQLPDYFSYLPFVSR